MCEKVKWCVAFLILALYTPLLQLISSRSNTWPSPDQIANKIVFKWGNTQILSILLDIIGLIHLFNVNLE